MRLNARQLAVAFVDIAIDTPEKELPDMIRSFVTYLSRRRQRKLLPAVVRAIEADLNARNGITPVRVITATAVEVAQLKAALGTHVEVTTATDPAVIGGAIIERGDERIDASVRTKLLQLKMRLSH